MLLPSLAWLYLCLLPGEQLCAGLDVQMSVASSDIVMAPVLDAQIRSAGWEYRAEALAGSTEQRHLPSPVAWSIMMPYGTP